MWLIRELYSNRNRHYLTVAANSVAIFLVLIMNIFSSAVSVSLNQQFGRLGLDVSLIQIIDPTHVISDWQRILRDRGNSPVMTSFRSFSQNRLTVSGCSQQLSQLFDVPMKQGRFISAMDVDCNDNVAVLGQTAWENTGRVKLNESVTVEGVEFKVIGIIEQTESSPFIDFDNSIFIPEGYLNDKAQISCYYRGVISETVLDEVIGKNNYVLLSQGQLDTMSDTITGAIKAVMMSLGYVSMAVAVIGLVNATLSNVRERSYEIAVKKVLGAGELDLYGQFLLEMALILLVSCAISLLAVYGVISLINGSGLITVRVDYQDNLLLMVRMTVIGLVCGLYPAKKAASVSVMEALRSH